MLDWRLYKSYKFEVKFSCNVVKDSGCGVLMLIFTSQKAACHLNCSVPEVLIADGTIFLWISTISFYTKETQLILVVSLSGQKKNILHLGFYIYSFY